MRCSYALLIGIFSLVCVSGALAQKPATEKATPAVAARNEATFLQLVQELKARTGTTLVGPGDRFKLYFEEAQNCFIEAAKKLLSLANRDVFKTGDFETISVDVTAYFSYYDLNTSDSYAQIPADASEEAMEIHLKQRLQELAPLRELLAQAKNHIGYPVYCWVGIKECSPTLKLLSEIEVPPNFSSKDFSIIQIVRPNQFDTTIGKSSGLNGVLRLQSGWSASKIGEVFSQLQDGDEVLKRTLKSYDFRNAKVPWVSCDAELDNMSCSKGIEKLLSGTIDLSSIRSRGVRVIIVKRELKRDIILDGAAEIGFQMSDREMSEFLRTAPLAIR